MIARLILAVLLAAFAMPAMASAPCHDDPAAMAGMGYGMAMDHSAPAAPEHDRKAVASHACMGCIPPAMLARHIVSAPPTPDATRRPITGTRFTAAPVAPPATPPPRITV